MRWMWNGKPAQPPARRRTGVERRTHGVNVFEDLQHRVPGFSVGVVFDVGANIGATALDFRRRFSSSSVYCFEPVSSTFARLKENLGATTGMHPYPIAFGAAPGRARTVVQNRSVNNSLLPPDEDPPFPGGAVETVDVDTPDAFCARERIDRIDILKIDTEGWGLEVLRGGSGLMAGRRVRIIHAEAGMNRYSRRHVPLHRIQEFLETEGFVLFRLYNQTFEWTGEARLRFCNAMFIQSELAESARRRPVPCEGLRPQGRHAG